MSDGLKDEFDKIFSEFESRKNADQAAIERSQQEKLEALKAWEHALSTIIDPALSEFQKWMQEKSLSSYIEVSEKAFGIMPSRKFVFGSSLERTINKPSLTLTLSGNHNVTLSKFLPTIRPKRQEAPETIAISGLSSKHITSSLVDVFREIHSA